MLIPIHNPSAGKLRVIGYASGSGDTLWKAYELQKEMEKTLDGCPFEIVGVFSSSSEAKVIATAEKMGIPCVSLDIREYYRQKDKPLKDREVRQQYDAEAVKLLAPMNGDVILLAGYVWATTENILKHYLLVNVHPADLSITKDGKRAYAGANGVGDALKGHEPYLCSSSHLATKEVDGGPILLISERIPVDYDLHCDDESRMKHYLGRVNEQSRLVGARTLLEIASGNFATDENGKVHYKGQLAPTGLRIESWAENRPLHERNTEKLLYPQTVAVIGASNKPGIGRSIVNNILRDGFQGQLYAVNMRGEDVMDARGHSSIAEIDGPVDLAVIATPGASVLDIAEQCGQKGVAALVCISAGFKEIGAEGEEAQRKLIEIVNRYNMRLIGPNCMGEMNVKAKLNATILTNPIVKGNVALVTQSGAIGAAMLDYAEQLGIGFSSMVSLGNQADINVCDLLPFYEEDENTRVVVLYLESILDPVRFYKLASKMTKPILLLKAGRTGAGMAAASSHTGSLAGNDKIVDALLKKAGVTRVYSLEDCFLCATALSNMPVPQGKRVGLLTNAGGPGILLSDALSELGFTLPTPSDAVAAYLRENLLREASVNNPIDIVATAPVEHYVLAAKAMLESGEYDALLICCVPPATVDTAAVAQALVSVLKSGDIPVLTNFLGPTIGKGARDILVENGIPVSEYPEQLASMLSGMLKRKGAEGHRVSKPLGEVTEKAKNMMTSTPEGEYLPIEHSYELLRLFGIQAASSVLLTSAHDVQSAALCYPVVAKIDHDEIIHKSDVGGVRLNIGSAEELAAVTEEFLQKFPGANGVLAQEQVPQGLELIVGSSYDPCLGHAIMVGLGGVWVEIMKDIAFGYAPLGQEEAMALINSLRCEPLLSGYRGKSGVNKQALAQLLERLSTMLITLPSIAEIDLNPVIFDPSRDQFIAADVRIKKA